MNNNYKKAIGALASLTLVAGAGASIALSDVPTGTTEPKMTGETIQRNTLASSPFITEAEAAGTFSYSQEALSSNASISEVFLKAASTLCSALPQYDTVNASPEIRVDGDVDESFTATVDEMANSEGTEKYIMACACASNVAGGGAI
ncbi:MAG: hypothetical protein RR619_11655, partial [Raoultibacter sp.]